MLLEKIKTDSRFSSYMAQSSGIAFEKTIIDTTCCENNVCADIDESITEENYVIIKVDSYFQKFRSENTPKGVDCLILVKGRLDKYCLYLIELKDEGSSGIRNKIDIITGKFQDTIDFLLKNREFAQYFNRIFEDVNFFLISKVDFDSQRRNQRDSLLEAQAYRNLLTKVYKVPLNPIKRTELAVSINMKHRDTEKLITTCI